MFTTHAIIKLVFEWMLLLQLKSYAHSVISLIFALTSFSALFYDEMNQLMIRSCRVGIPSKVGQMFVLAGYK